MEKTKDNEREKNVSRMEQKTAALLFTLVIGFMNEIYSVYENGNNHTN